MGVQECYHVATNVQHMHMCQSQAVMIIDHVKVSLRDRHAALTQTLSPVQTLPVQRLREASASKSL